jgi:hypothetical protein
MSEGEAVKVPPGRRTKNLPRGGKAFRFVVSEAEGGYRWELVSPIGRPVAHGDGFPSREAAEAAAAKFRGAVAEAPILPAP